MISDGIVEGDDGAGMEDIECKALQHHLVKTAIQSLYNSLFRRSIETTRKTVESLYCCGKEIAYTERNKPKE